jgi:hypothetical protein
VYSSTKSDHFDESTFKKWKKLNNDRIDKNTYIEYSLFFRDIFNIKENELYDQKISNIIFNICISQYSKFEIEENKKINFIEEKNSKLLFTSIFIIAYSQSLSFLNIIEFIKKTLDIRKFIECTQKIIELYDKGKNNKSNDWNKLCSKIMNEEELNTNIIEIKKKIKILIEELEKLLEEHEELSSVDEEPPTKKQKKDGKKIKNKKYMSLNKKMKSRIKRSRRRSRSRSKCKKYLSKKIGINIAEFYNGFYMSKPQAIAVAYSQVRKSHPHCKRIIKQRSKRRSKRRM